MVHRHIHKRQGHLHGGGGSIPSPPAPTTAAPTAGGPKPAPPTHPAPVDPPSGGPIGPSSVAPHTSDPASSTSTSNDDGSTKTSDKQTSTKYVTATWTGTGTEFSLSTVTSIQTTSSTPLPIVESTTPEPAETTPTTQTLSSRTSRRSHKVSSTESSPSSAAATTSNSVSASASATTAATTLSSILSISSSATSASQAAATTSSTAPGISQNTGLSGGAKAGIAIGVILGVLALLAGAFALYRMKKNRDEAAYENENSTEKNPFSDTAALNLGPVRAASPPVVPTGASNPFGTGAVQMAPNPTSNGLNGGAMAAAGGLAGAAIGATAANMTRANAPPPLNVNRAQSPALAPPPPVVPSPVGSSFSESSTLTAGGMAAIGGAGAGGLAGPRMHRVQMDFTPSMDDELRIVVGEIVRIVREFDDGWCSVELVQRDGQGNVIRHQQGVVPRTCLSRLPLKPRQRRPGPPGAGPSAQGPGRMQSPAFASNPVGRSMSPGPYGGGPQDRPQRPDARSRSNSANDINFRSRVAGPGPSRMNPASQNLRPAEPLVQSQSLSALPVPGFPGHNRNESAASSASAPVARKPLPGQFDA